MSNLQRNILEALNGGSSKTAQEIAGETKITLSQVRNNLCNLCTRGYTKSQKDDGLPLGYKITVSGQEKLKRMRISDGPLTTSQQGVPVITPGEPLPSAFSASAAVRPISPAGAIPSVRDKAAEVGVESEEKKVPERVQPINAGQFSFKPNLGSGETRFGSDAEFRALLDLNGSLLLCRGDSTMSLNPEETRALSRLIRSVGE